MRERKCIRYIAECGKGFWDKKSCKNHEQNCKCWTNPKNKTCKTCQYGDYAPYENDTGYGGFWECNHPTNQNEHTGGPEGVDYISVGCEFYQHPELINRR